jgi:hypothetical protein
MRAALKYEGDTHEHNIGASATEKPPALAGGSIT